MAPAPSRALLVEGWRSSVGCGHRVFVRERLVAAKLASIAGFIIASGYDVTTGELCHAAIALLPDTMSFYDGLRVVLALFAAWRWSQPSFP